MHETPRIFRNFALPLPTFEYMKNFQRDYEARFGSKLSNTQVLTLIVSQHQQLTQSASALASAPQDALLRTA